MLDDLVHRSARVYLAMGLGVAAFAVLMLLAMFALWLLTLV